MTVARPIVAIIPFGARGTTPRAGAWARQLAARLVERFAQDATVDVEVNGHSEINIVDLLRDSKIAKSRSDALRLVKQGGVSVD